MLKQPLKNLWQRSGGITKRWYNKAHGMFFYQYVQSFSPDENITPLKAHEIGLELAEYFSDYEVLIATHMDSNHLHNHFIINSVSHVTGLKLQEGPDSLFKLRNLSDEICAKRGLTILPSYVKKSEKGLGAREYRAAIKGDSWKFKLMNTIDICLKNSKNKAEFISNMRKYGYEANWSDNRKYITYTTPDGIKCRDKKLHDKKYLKSEMEGYYERIGEFERAEQASEYSRSRTDIAETLRNTSLRHSQRTMGGFNGYSAISAPNSGGNNGAGESSAYMEQYAGQPQQSIFEAREPYCESFGKGDNTHGANHGENNTRQPQHSESEGGIRLENRLTENSGRTDGKLNHISQQPRGKRFDSGSSLYEMGSRRSRHSNRSMNNYDNTILAKTKQTQTKQEVDLEEDMDFEMEM